MYFKDIGYLMYEEVEKNHMNRPVKKYTEKKVYCNVKSVGFNEFFQAQVAGYKPELKIQLKLVNIEGATHFKHKGKLYKIIRYFRYQDIIELTLNAMVVENG